MPTYPATKPNAPVNPRGAGGTATSTGLRPGTPFGGLKPGTATGGLPIFSTIFRRPNRNPVPPVIAGRGSTSPAPGQPANSQPSSLSPIYQNQTGLRPPAPVSTGTPTPKATSPAVNPASAGSVRTASAVAAADNDAADTNDVSQSVFNADMTKLDQQIKTMQTTNARQSQQITDLTNQVKTTQSQIGQNQTAAATAAGATATGTGSTGAATSTAGGISGFLTSTTGKLAIVAVLAVGGWFYVRQNGGLGGFFKESDEGESNA